MFHELNIFIDSLANQREMLIMAIFFLMALESSLFPVPSELVMIPAWVIAYNSGIPIWIIIASGTFGSLVGACANYLLASFLWIPAILKFGKYFGITEVKYQRTEKLFLKNSVLYTFLGRLIPVVRHLISLPAWVFLMSPRSFTLATVAGAWIWCSVLTIIGYMGWKYGPHMMELAEWYLKYTGLVLLAVACIVAIVFLVRIQENPKIHS